MKFGQDVGNQLNNRLPSSNFKILENKHIIFIRTSQPLILALLGEINSVCTNAFGPIFCLDLEVKAGKGQPFEKFTFMTSISTIL